jgi:uncharacterized protein (DUF736 family)
VPSVAKTADRQSDIRVLTQGIEIGPGSAKRGETSGNGYVSLPIAALDFGPKAQRRCRTSIGADNRNFLAVIWNPGD